MERLVYGPLQLEDIQPQVQRSWQRSHEAGLEEHTDPGLQIVNRKLLNEKKTNFLLQKYSQSIIFKYERIVRASKTRVLLCDADGIILDSWGSDHFLHTAERVALLPGVSWHEKNRGTNAIGTAIAEKKPAIILGENHYLESIRKVSCAGCPIIDGKGYLVGVMDISGHSSCFNIENIYLAQMMAMDLENMLLMDRYADKDTVELTWAYGPLAKGLLFFDRDYLVAANKVVCEMFQLSFPIHDICGEDMIDGFKDLYENPNSQKLLKPKNGVYCYAQLTRKKTYLTQTVSSCRRKEPDPRVSKAQTQGLLAINRDIPLYVSGETGVGKEWMVKSLHRQSNRKSGPLIIVNCCSLPEQLVESELFGHVAGAFTGANPKGTAGYILQADKGILFLDEIADLSMRIQTKLLRILQDKVLTPVGSTRSHKLDFCLVSASHKDLNEEVRQGRFRKDLYFRLNGIEINIPPLRERLDFSAVLTNLVNKYGKNHRISSDLMERLLYYSWPGNIRQLDHFINIICALAGDDIEITWSHLPDNLKHDLQNPDIRPILNTQSESSAGDQDHLLESRLNQIALETFKANGGNVSKTAKILGISRNTLYKTLRQAGIDFKKK